MSFQAIVDRFGLTPQAVHETLQRNGYLGEMKHKEGSSASLEAK
jgi:hypothetical protein